MDFTLFYYDLISIPFSFECKIVFLHDSEMLWVFEILTITFFFGFSIDDYRGNINLLTLYCWKKKLSSYDPESDLQKKNISFHLKKPLIMVFIHACGRSLKILAEDINHLQKLNIKILIFY